MGSKLLVFLALFASAHQPQQFNPCSAKNPCAPGLACLQSSNGQHYCHLRCSETVKCPEEQRCLKDGRNKVCHRVISDRDLPASFDLNGLPGR
jgi:hypothetical protein